MTCKSWSGGQGAGMLSGISSVRTSPQPSASSYCPSPWWSVWELELGCLLRMRAAPFLLYQRGQPHPSSFSDNSTILLLLLTGKMQETGGICFSGSSCIPLLSPLSRMGRVDFNPFSSPAKPVSCVASSVQTHFTCIKGFLQTGN